MTPKQICQQCRERNDLDWDSKAEDEWTNDKVIHCPHATHWEKFIPKRCKFRTEHVLVMQDTYDYPEQASKYRKESAKGGSVMFEDPDGWYDESRGQDGTTG